MAFLRHEGEFASAPRPNVVVLDVNVLGQTGFDNMPRSLRVTPAMESNLTDHIWTIRELLS